MRFKKEEYFSRQNKAIQSIKSSGLNALLMFAPESQYWICGYDTFGFSMFQCLILNAKGDLNLLTRSPDFRQALYTSTLSEPEIHIWNEIEEICMHTPDSLSFTTNFFTYLDNMGLKT